MISAGMKIEKSRPKVPIYFSIYSLSILFILFFPLLVMLVGAWLKNTENGLVWTAEWFMEVFQDKVLLEAMYRSLWVALVSSFFATGIGTLTAIALERISFPGKKVVHFLSSISLAMPELVFALALLSWFALLQVPLSLITVTVAHITFCLAYVVITVSARLQILDQSVEDAARDLGASEGQVLWHILLPLLKPAIISGFLLSLLVSFDDFLVTYYLSGAGNDTLPVKLYTSMRMGLSPKLNALASIMFFICAGIGFAYFLLIRGRGYRFRRG